MEYQRLSHTFEPVYDEHSQILILGSFPSAKSRENEFFYGHPQNRFWKVLAAVCQDELPGTVEEKKCFLLRNRIALWDVIAQCDIMGSSDSSIKNVVPTDVSYILERAPISTIYANGGKAYELYRKYLEPVTGQKCIRLPSTSPANAAFGLERLILHWRQIMEEHTDAS